MESTNIDTATITLTISEVVILKRLLIKEVSSVRYYTELRKQVLKEKESVFSRYDRSKLDELLQKIYDQI